MTRIDLGRRGMTLIEILIALTIFGIIVGAAFSALRSQSEAFRLGGQRMDALMNLRFSVGMIERDLRTAGSNLPSEQPSLVYLDNNVVAINGDYATNIPNDPYAVYYDPDAPLGSVTALTRAQQITIPLSGFSYPSVSYTGAGGAGNSPGETMIFFFTPDSSTTRTDDFALFRQVNRDRPQLVARNLLRTGNTPFLQYRRIQRAGPTVSVVPIATNQLPLTHSIATHGAPDDSGTVAVIDSVRAMLITLSTTNGLSGADERIRSIERFVHFANVGTPVKKTCGDRPLLGTGLTVTVDTVAGGSPVVNLSWNKSVDEGGGESDITRYVLWRRAVAEPDWGDPYLSLPAGDVTYSYQDLAVTSGDRLYYALAAQDCTPTLSNMTQSSLVVIP